MADDATVTFELPTGTKVTCSQELAEQLGHKASEPAKRGPGRPRKTD